jgi:hypothetical protein
MGNLDVKTLKQMDTPKLVFYEHSFEDPIKTSLAKSVLNLGIECRALAEENARLKAEVEVLKGRVNYWKIEAECDHGRWMRTLEDLEHLRNQK